MAELKLAKSHTGIACVSIIQLEKHSIKPKDNPELLKVKWPTMQSLTVKVQTLYDTLNENHYFIANQAEEKAVENQQDVLDEHEDNMFIHDQLFKGSEPRAALTLMKEPS